MAQPIRTYTVGWICALDVEFSASQLFFDEDHGDQHHIRDVNDDNAYFFGSIHGHNVVMAVLPAGEYGTASAASVAKDMLRSFPDIRFGLMVGIGGGVPFWGWSASEVRDIRLGDVVVSQPGVCHGGIVQYDYGKKIQSEDFQPTGHLDRPPRCLLTAIQKLKTRHDREGNGLDTRVQEVLSRYPRLRARYGRPRSKDVLHAVNTNQHADMSANESSKQDYAQLSIVERSPRDPEYEDISQVHYGLIASGNTLLKDALMRNSHATKGVLCFEMEAAGLMNTGFKCLVIRGICDYCDTYKNKEWQGYAAMVAAAYASDLLSRVPRAEVEREGKMDVEGILHDIQIDVAVTRRTTHDILGDTRRIREILIRFQDERVFDWITPVDYGPMQSSALRSFSDRRRRAIQRKYSGNVRFREWLSTKDSTLTFHSRHRFHRAAVTDAISRLIGDQSTIGFAYVYCDPIRGRPPQHYHVDDLLASLAKQLAAQAAYLPKECMVLYDKHRKHKTRPTLPELRRLLFSIVSHFDRVFLLVDLVPRDMFVTTAWNALLYEMYNLKATLRINIHFSWTRPSTSESGGNSILSLEGPWVGFYPMRIGSTKEDI